MCDELCLQDLESLPRPKDWTANVRHAVLNVIGIVRIAMLAGREFLIREGKPYVAQIHRLETEVAMQREELRINGARSLSADLHQMLALPLRASSGTRESSIQIVKDRNAFRGVNPLSEGRLWLASRCIYVHDENRWSAITLKEYFPNDVSPYFDFCPFAGRYPETQPLCRKLEELSRPPALALADRSPSCRRIPGPIRRHSRLAPLPQTSP